jgi:GntR family transcriptional regulator
MPSSKPKSFPKPTPKLVPKSGQKQFKFDPRDNSPLYAQLARKLGQAVREGQYLANEALPSERLLSESLGVSRVTARKAIDQLVDQGLIVRRQGSGNYIAPRFEQALTRLSSFSEELSRRGYRPSSQWLKRAITAATPEEQLSLNLNINAKVARLERLRLADDVVMAYEVSVLPVSIVNRPTDIEGSLYQYLEEFSHVPVRAVQHIRALNAHGKLAERLGIAEGQAVLFITRLGYLESGQPVELTISYCRNDYYDFIAEMRRE